jgi:hypothetical protein
LIIIFAWSLHTEVIPCASQRTTSPSIKAGPHLEVVHGCDQEREALRPVVAPAGDKPDADRVTTRHEPKPVVLDLVDPVGTSEPDGGLSAADGRQGSMKAARSAASRLRIRSINMLLI